MGNQDVSLFKFFRITETKNVEFRMEMFNAPNHVLLNVGGQLSWNNRFPDNAWRQVVHGDLRIAGCSSRSFRERRPVD